MIRVLDALRNKKNTFNGMLQPFAQLNHEYEIWHSPEVMSMPSGKPLYLCLGIQVVRSG